MGGWPAKKHKVSLGARHSPSGVRQDGSSPGPLDNVVNWISTRNYKINKMSVSFGY